MQTYDLIGNIENKFSQIRQEIKLENLMRIFGICC